MSNSLTIVTVVRNPGTEFLMTFDSVFALIGDTNLKIKWLILDGSDETTLIIKGICASLKSVRNVEVISIQDSGIYDAINQSLRLIDTSHFMFIHSGDKVLPTIISVLGDLSEDSVDCFKSQWHGQQAETLATRDPIRYSPFFGVMPNHQGMIFPRIFTEVEYDLRFPIAADLDLKLKLHRRARLCFRDTQIVSSLDGGLSSSALALSSVASRTKEIWAIFRKHYGLLHSFVATVPHALNFLLRVRYDRLVPFSRQTII